MDTNPTTSPADNAGEGTTPAGEVATGTATAETGANVNSGASGTDEAGSAGPEADQAKIEYDAAKIESAQKYQEWNKLSTEEQDSDAGKELGSRLTELHRIIDRYEQKRAEANVEGNGNGPITDTDNLTKNTPGTAIDTPGTDGEKETPSTEQTADAPPAGDVAEQENKIKKPATRKKATASDGNTSDTEEAPKFDLKLGNRAAGFINQKEAKGLIENSQINQHYKDIMLEQIGNGQLDEKYVDTLVHIKTAKDGGSVYRPGQDGL